MKKLGILGGMGPLAGARFLETVIRMTDADIDADHPEVLLYSASEIPDRTAFLLGQSPVSPLPALLRAAADLTRWGAEVLAMPCITAHSFYEPLSREAEVPILNAVEETAGYLKERGIHRAGLLATDGTIRSGIFCRALENAGINPVLPKEQDTVMELIYRCLKRGRKPNRDICTQLLAELEHRGAEVTILGCTELSLMAQALPQGHRVLDASAVLARQAVLASGARLRPEYRELIMV